MKRWLTFPLLLALASGLAGVAYGQAAGDYAAVRARLRATQTGGDGLNTADAALATKVTSLNASAQSHWNNLNKAANRTTLWSDLTVSATASDTLTPLFDRLKTMAAAYATSGAALRGNTALRDDIVSALQWLNTSYYNPGRPFYDNWFPWHLGVPLNVVDTFACLHDGLTTATRSSLYGAYATAIDYYQRTAGATFAETGANRIWRAHIDVGLGAALENSDRLGAGRDKLSTVLPYVTGGDGFYVDGSFVQHNTHSYTGGYGLYLLNDLSIVLEAVAGTAWRVTDPNLGNIFRWVDDAYDPVLFRGAIMDMTRGREIARSGSTDHASGHPTLTAIARVAQFADANTAARFRALVKGHLQADAYRGFINSAGLAAAALVKPTLDDPAIAPRAARVGCFVFAGMERIVHQRGAWAYAVSLSSKRISKYESINGENLHGWYLGDGAAYLYNGDLAQYADQYWPTVNPYRLAGTTVDNRTRADAGTSSPNTTNPLTTKAWVGGSTVLGEYGSAGLDHEAALSDLAARKSWFFFDNEVVHLGAGIVTSADNPYRVETIVENRLIGGAGSSGPAIFTAEGIARAATDGATDTLVAVTSAHLAAPMQSAFGNADIGYYFPERPTLLARRETRSGKYSDINRGPFTNSAVQNRSYLSLWIDHGAQLVGEGARYAYVVLPGYSQAQTAAYALNPDVEILANTSAVQAVRDRGLKATGINFWTAGRVADVTASGPASLTYVEHAGMIDLGLADPTQENAGTIDLELPFAAEAVTAKDPAITVTALAPRLRLQFAVAGTRGRSLAATAKLAVNPDAAPVITRQPADLVMPAGGTAAFNVAITAQPPPTFQWLRNGTVIPGATDDTLVLRSLGAADASAYACRVTNRLGTVTTQSAVLAVTSAGANRRSRLANLSARGVTGAGAPVMIVGFVVDAGAPAAGLPLLIRGVGPSLRDFGVTGTLADPVLTVFSGSTPIATNDDWDGDGQVAAVGGALGAFPLASAQSRDAAIYRLGFTHGAYTAQVAAGGAGSGIVLAEIYDASPVRAGPGFANLSALARTGVGDDLLIAGLAIAGEEPRTVLLRAVGPSLASHGVTGALADPKLELYAGSAKLLENDNWSGSATLAAVSAQVGAFALPAGSLDAVLITTLPPGNYTMQVSGVSGSTGLALAEIYEVP